MANENLPAKRAEVIPPIIPAEPEDIISFARKAAKVLVKTIDETKTVVIVRGQKYLRFEHWQLLGTFAKALYGGIVGAKATNAEPIADKDGKVIGFRAEAVALLNGEVIGGALAYCYRNEKGKDGKLRWRNAEDFQVASMAQTRACSKALRNVLAWIVTLGGADNIKTTPAEEMEEANGAVANESKSEGPPSDVYTSILTKIEDATKTSDLKAIPNLISASGLSEREQADLKQHYTDKQTNLKK